MGRLRVLAKYLILDRVVNPLLRTGAGLLLIVMTCLALLGTGILLHTHPVFGRKPLILVLAERAGLSHVTGFNIAADILAFMGYLVVLLVRRVPVTEAEYEIFFSSPVRPREYLIARSLAELASLASLALWGTIVGLIDMALILDPLVVAEWVRLAALVVVVVLVSVGFAAWAEFLGVVYLTLPEKAGKALRAAAAAAAIASIAAAWAKTLSPLAVPFTPYAALLVYPFSRSIAASTCLSYLPLAAIISVSGYPAAYLLAGRLESYQLSPYRTSRAGREAGLRLSYGSERRLLYSLALSDLLGPRGAGLAALCMAISFAIGRLILVATGGGATLLVAGSLGFLVAMTTGILAYSVVLSDIAPLVNVFWVFKVYLRNIRLFSEAYGARYGLLLIYAALCIAFLYLGAGINPLIATEIAITAIPTALLTGEAILAITCYAASRTRITSVREVRDREIFTVTYWPLSLGVEGACMASLVAVVAAALLGWWPLLAAGAAAGYFAARHLAGLAAERMDVLS